LAPESGWSLPIFYTLQDAPPAPRVGTVVTGENASVAAITLLECPPGCGFQQAFPFLTGVEPRLADGPVWGRLIARFSAVIGMPLNSETNHAGHQEGIDPVARFTHGKALAVRPIGACFLQVKVTSLDDGSAPAGIQDRGGEYST